MLDVILKKSVEGLRIEAEQGMVGIRLDRAGGNRFSLDMLEGLAEALTRLQALPDVRVVVLTAEGADFSFGADLTDSRLAGAVAGSRADRETVARTGQAAVDAWANLSVPTIAAARGRIIGAGACFFCTADFQVAASSAAVQFPEVDRGMHLSWGILPRLAVRYGLPWATELSLTGEPVECSRLPQPPLRIAEAPDSAARELAVSLAAKPPLAVRAIKRVLADSATALQRAAEKDAALFADTIGSEDFAEAMTAWFEKRPGVFKGR